jgi:hypothetical protein
MSSGAVEDGKVLFFAVQTFVHVLDSDKTNFSANYVN